MRTQPRVRSNAYFPLVLIGTFVALCSGLCLRAFGELPPEYHDPTLQMSLQDDALRSMEIVCRYPTPLVLFHTQQGHTLYARVHPDALVKSPCPKIDESYSARLRVQQKNIEFDILGSNKKLFTRIDWSFVFHRQQRALVLLHSWIQRQFKNPEGTIPLWVKVQPIATVQQLLEQCKSGRYPGDVPDDVPEVYTLPYRYVRYGNQALPSIVEKTAVM